MKNFLLVFLIFCSLQVKAQNYLISFAGTGASTSVSTVKVENLTSGATLTMNGSNILRLTTATGINVNKDYKSSELKIYPNPMTDITIFEIFPPVAGNAVISVLDMTGKQLAHIQSYLENQGHTFILSGLKNGFYIVSVKGKNYQFSGKLLSNGKSYGTINIEKVNNIIQTVDEKTEILDSKGTQATIDMTYANGDRLKFTGISDNYSTVKTDIPAADKTITFYFLGCTDTDNNDYPIVEIGNQIWMAENLKTTKYRGGTFIPLETDPTMWSLLSTPAYCFYDNDINNKGIYGALYNYYTIASKNICPIGWGVPSFDEWTVLINYLGGESVTGGKLKETGITHWSAPNAGATNETGFTSLPGSQRDLFGAFYGIYQMGRWWSSTKFSNSTDSPVYSIGMSIANQVVEKSTGEHVRSGNSVRCLKKLPVLTTTEASSIRQTTITSGGNITSGEGAAVTARGVCWSTSPNPTIANSKTTDGSGTGEFTCSITGLSMVTTYYVRAYATMSFVTSYGNQVSFTTLNVNEIPLNTTAISSIGRNTATSGGNILTYEGALVTARGVCWSTSANPTIVDNKTSDGLGAGQFISSMTGLTAGTTYYVRAYATTVFGTNYGPQLSFITINPNVPTLTTTAVSLMTDATVTSGGNITSDEGSVVTERGVCWSITTNPTTADNKTIDGTGSGVFFSLISGLEQVTTYYLRAYATNGVGTGYGNVISFKLPISSIIFNPNLNYGTVTDIDGNSYKTIVIGTQTWMAENLKTTKYNDGTAIPLASINAYQVEAPFYCWYNDDEANYKPVYGALYNWFTVDAASNGSKNVCPAGWHVPTDTEWTTLTTYLGGEIEAGGRLKETSTTHWIGPDTGATNSSGFTAIPGAWGFLDDTRVDIGFYCGFWTTTVSNAFEAWERYLVRENSNVYRNKNLKEYGYSIRCLKDN